MNPQKSRHPLEDSSGESHVLRKLNRTLQRRSPDGCPDEALLAALAEGRLSDVENERLFTHLAECSTCLETYRLLRDLMGDAPARPRNHRFWAPMALAASLVLVVISLWLVDPRDAELAPRVAPTPTPVAHDEMPEVKTERETSPDASTRAGQPKADKSPQRSSIAEDTDIPIQSINGPRKHHKKRSAKTTPANEKPAESREKTSMAKRKAAQEERIGHQREPRKSDGFAAAIRPVRAQEDARTLLPTPPATTTPGRVKIYLEFLSNGRVSRITMDPPDSALAGFLRRELSKPDILRKMAVPGQPYIILEWNGTSWRVQPGAPSDSGTSGGGGASSAGMSLGPG